MSEVFEVSNSPDAVLDVVFIHGLDGDARRTWSGDNPGSFWPSWLAEEGLGAAVYTVGYSAWSSGWRGRSMSIPDRALNLMALLQNRGIGDRPLCFVTHSMGGLLVKEILLNASDGRTDFTTFATATRGVVFLATPHTGAGLAKAIKALGVLYRGTAAVEDLRRNDAHLRHVNDRYRDWVADTSIRHSVLFETRPTKGMLVVDETSANPGIAQVRPIPVDANHIDICKPFGRSSLVYGQVKRLVNNLAHTLTPGSDRTDGTCRDLISDQGIGQTASNWIVVEKCQSTDTQNSRASNHPLRILFAIDASQEMAGTRMGLLNHAMRELVPTLHQIADENPAGAIEIEVLAFGTRARWITQAPVPLADFYWTDISADATTERPRSPRLNPALRALAAALDGDELPKVTIPPALVLILASSPTDDISSGLHALTTSPWGRQSVRIGIPIGDDADLKVLRQFAGDERIISPAHAKDFIAYLKWVPVKRHDPDPDDVW